MLTPKGFNYPLPALLCLLLCHYSLPLILAQTCPKQCECIKDLIHCHSPYFPIVLPTRIVSEVLITGNIRTLPKNAVVQPKACNLTKIQIQSSLISDIEPFCLSGLKVSSILLIAKIRKLQPKAFANISCKMFTIRFSTINRLQLNSFHGLTATELIMCSSSLPYLTLEPSHLINVDSLTISKCRILLLEMNFPIGNLSVTISHNKIRSIDSNAIVGGSFYENQVFCSCNMSIGRFANDTYNKNSFKNSCPLPSNLKGLLLVNMNQSEICNQFQNETGQFDIDIIPDNSASRFFKLNQVWVFFLVFVLNSLIYHL